MTTIGEQDDLRPGSKRWGAALICVALSSAEAFRLSWISKWWTVMPDPGSLVPDAIVVAGLLGLLINMSSFLMRSAAVRGVVGLSVMTLFLWFGLDAIMWLIGPAHLDSFAASWHSPDPVERVMGFVTLGFAILMIVVCVGAIWDFVSRDRFGAR